METVIKIKFGDTLRRIYMEDFDFDMVALREKICTLFGLNLDVDFTLTYIDEDEDVVTLCDDNDLDDLESQSLNPIRMTVRLNPDNHAKPSLTSNENSAPVTSTQNQLPIQSLNSAVTIILRHVPERLHNAFLKLLLDLVWQNMTGVSYTLPGEDGSRDSKNGDLQLETEKKDRGLADIDLNIPYSESETVQFPENDLDIKGYSGSVDFGTCVDLNQCPFIGMPLSSDPFVHASPTPSDEVGSITIHKDIVCDGCEVHPITGPRFKSKLKDDFDLCGLCFEESGHDAADYIRIDLPLTCSTPKGFQKDPEVVINPNMDQKSEICENKSIRTVTIESEDMYFDAQAPQKDKETKT
ncbi:hypothetical protein L2E82_27351 [Cichorium intybus]|uniref:Uncharacterized protein n=1 Tax=Cichorium intybus TaxID=13427 RepID=A0ACB9CT48_CICIN|nr:hypothetical protein L2E82_27351 [Cichorium intybus]